MPYNNTKVVFNEDLFTFGFGMLDSLSVCSPKGAWMAGGLKIAKIGLVQVHLCVVCMSVALCENAICPGEFVSMGDCDDTHGNQAFAVRRTPFGAALLQSKMDERKCLTACE